MEVHTIGFAALIICAMLLPNIELITQIKQNELDFPPSLLGKKNSCVKNHLSHNDNKGMQSD
jgi:hypothetical protein